jgi:hypothetical protein
MIELPKVYFGKVNDKKVDWRKFEEEDPDDEEMEETPDDVKGILGFDPKKL